MAKESNVDLYFQEAAYYLSGLEDKLKKAAKEAAQAQMTLLRLYQIAKEEKDE